MNGAKELKSPVDLNYFVCTLGQAAEFKTLKQQSWATVNDFIDHQASAHPDDPAVGFPIPSDYKDSSARWRFAVYTFEELRCRSSEYALSLGALLSRRKSNRTVALLYSSSVEFLFSWLGLMRCGASILLIAPQCQPSAIAHLCRECHASVLLSDLHHFDLAKAARGPSGDSNVIEAICLSEINDGKTDGGHHQDCEGTRIYEPQKFRQSQLWPVSDSDVAYLHHTSGTSTGLPKPIPQTHRAAIGVLPSLGNNEAYATFTTTPLYHGGVADCFRAWTSGAMIWLFPGGDVPITASNILKSLDCTRSAEALNGTPAVHYFSSVPYVLQMLATEPDGLELLRQMTLVGVGGAALPPSVGDHLVHQDVNLLSRFGSAECGFLMSSHRNYTVDKEWQYLRSNGSNHLRFEPRDGGLAELVILPTWPHMAKRNRDDGSYATADLFEPHPEISGAWKYHSRADSQLTLVTGKKFDPAPLEAAIATSPLLSDCLIFGNGQQYPGALLFRSSSSVGMTNEEILDDLWPMVNNLNCESQAHTRLPKSMLIVMPKDAPSLEKSSKGTILRGVAEKKFATEISKAYENEANADTIKTFNGDSTELVSDDNVPLRILEIIKGVISTKNPIPEDADLFSFGVDSVACMQIRALLQNEILAGDAFKLPLNVVYDCGTIRDLAKYLVSVRKGAKYEKESEVDQMQALVAEYSTFETYPIPTPHIAAKRSNGLPDPNSNGEIVVLTGATGALGAHILDQLRASPHVSQIHCLVRAGSLIAARERVSKSLVARGKAPLQGETSSSKIKCHPCKLSDPHLGLARAPEYAGTYATLVKQTTIIVHAAWAVNFSMRLSSFVKDHIAGLRNLINFALVSPHFPPPRLIFCSSTASVLGPKGTSPIPETITHDPLAASPLGYSRSKWVAEAICEQAHLNTRLRDRISVLRIGQLCGDTDSGIWNVTEAWPLMLSSVKVTECLPDLNDHLEWLPVNIAAQAVLEIALSHNNSEGHILMEESKAISVYHILNPNAQTTWSNLLHWLQKLNAGFDVVPPSQWVSALENLKGEAAKHPAKKLLGLWKDAYAGNPKEEVTENKVFEMEQTRKAVKVMRNVQPIGEQQFEKTWTWIEREMVEKNQQPKDG